MPFTSNLGRIMTEQNVTYEDLQFEADLTSKTIARARDERISSCTLITLEKIAKALKADVKELFDYLPEECQK